MFIENGKYMANNLGQLLKFDNFLKNNYVIIIQSSHLDAPEKLILYLE